MSHIDHYQLNPAWATSQWQPMRPPPPSFTPKRSWTGYDFFKSSVGDMDVNPELYNYGTRVLMGPSPSYSASPSFFVPSPGESRTHTKPRAVPAVEVLPSRSPKPHPYERMEPDKAVVAVAAKLNKEALIQQEARLRLKAECVREAKLQHRRIYGGLGDILEARPQEIGAAAAYEVWRSWRYNYSILSQPLAGDVKKQRDALVGLAIAESAKLWPYTRRVEDAAGLAAAAEAAGICAERIFSYCNDALVRSITGSHSQTSSSSSKTLSPILGPTKKMHDSYGLASDDALGVPPHAPLLPYRQLDSEFFNQHIYDDARQFPLPSRTDSDDRSYAGTTTTRKGRAAYGRAPTPGASVLPSRSLPPVSHSRSRPFYPAFVDSDKTEHASDNDAAATRRQKEYETYLNERPYLSALREARHDTYVPPFVPDPSSY